MDCAACLIACLLWSTPKSDNAFICWICPACHTFPSLDTPTQYIFVDVCFKVNMVDSTHCLKQIHTGLWNSCIFESSPPPSRSFGFVLMCFPSSCLCLAPSNVAMPDLRFNYTFSPWAQHHYDSLCMMHGIQMTHFRTAVLVARMSSALGRQWAEIAGVSGMDATPSACVCWDNAGNIHRLFCACRITHRTLQSICLWSSHDCMQRLTIHAISFTHDVLLVRVSPG